jgi:hypothetical protein
LIFDALISKEPPVNKESVEMFAIQTDGCGNAKIIIATKLHTLRY